MCIRDRVWNFYRDMHLKANYASGFRPPVFNNTDSNGTAVQFGGSHQLSNETSQAFQGEWNAKPVSYTHLDVYKRQLPARWPS